MNPISPSQSTTRTYGVLADDDPEWVRIREQEDIYDRYVDSDDDQAGDPAAAHEPAPCIGCGQPTTLLLDTGEDRDGRVILEPACGPCQDGPPDDEPPTPKAAHTRHVEPKPAAAGGNCRAVPALRRVLLLSWLRSSRAYPRANDLRLHRAPTRRLRGYGALSV